MPTVFVAFVNNKPTRVVYVYFVLTVFCRFLGLYRPHCPKISNFLVRSTHCNVFSCAKSNRIEIEIEIVPNGQDGPILPAQVANQNTVCIQHTSVHLLFTNLNLVKRT